MSFQTRMTDFLVTLFQVITKNADRGFKTKKEPKALLKCHKSVFWNWTILFSEDVENCVFMLLLTESVL